MKPTPGLAMRLTLTSLLLAGCASVLDEHGIPTTTFSPKHLAKGDMDRVADTTRQEIREGLLKLAEKLYRRNPKEWRKQPVASIEEAVQRLRRQILPSTELSGIREGGVTLKAFATDYTGDRVAAFILGLLQMSDAAFNYQEEFFMLDRVDHQKLYNLARNFEIAAWKLGHAKNPLGELWLLSNSLSEKENNLSFEREFGRLIGLLDFHVKLMTDATGRSVTRFTQSIASAIFIPIGFLR